jgi:hypothetical protein
MTIPAACWRNASAVLTRHDHSIRVGSSLQHLFVFFALFKSVGVSDSDPMEGTLSTLVYHDVGIQARLCQSVPESDGVLSVFERTWIVKSPAQ